jgi:hypothetical protein
MRSPAMVRLRSFPRSREGRLRLVHLSTRLLLHSSVALYVLTLPSSSDSTALTKTPASKEVRRSSILGSQSPALSPKVLTDIVDSGSSKVRSAWNQSYEYLRIDPILQTVREYASGPWQIIALGVVYELYCLQPKLLPLRHAFNTPAVPYIKSTEVYGPHIFAILSTDFWYPFLLWFTTSTLIPAFTSYIINLSLKNKGTAVAARTRASDKKEIPYDPFIFCLTKGLISFLVYGWHFGVPTLLTDQTVTIVNTSIVGGYQALVTIAGLGAAASLYDAVLKK